MGMPLTGVGSTSSGADVPSDAIITDGLTASAYWWDGSELKTDTDADAFVTAVGTLNSTQQGAVTNAVIRMKLAGIWTKMVAVYPFVGGTAAAHKFNLKDPRDLDAAFRIVWGGTVTHDANGITGNGSTGYGDTKLVLSTGLNTNSCHWSSYGVGGGSSGIRFGNSNSGFYYQNQNTMGCASGTLNTGLGATYQSGQIIASKTASATERVYINGSRALAASIGDTALAAYSAYVLAWNSTGAAGNFSTANERFLTMGAGLSDIEANALYAIVQSFQAELGRVV